MARIYANQANAEASRMIKMFAAGSHAAASRVNRALTQAGP
jgi:hypothetical protein